MDNSVRWKGITARKIIVCQGVYGQQDPYFDWLPFRPVKGEVLTLEIPGMPAGSIINRGVFVLPLGNERFKVGATYHWKHLTWEPTPEARSELLEKFGALIKLPYRITGQQAGIRPATADRRPIIGLHPAVKTLGILNGLGSKGVSLAPLFAQYFVDYLEKDKHLPDEVNISRFFSLYEKHSKPYSGHS
jgi:glycine/D-amino acid oxidase-like deaminating enzyme